MLFLIPVDCSGRREDSCGLSWSGETPQERSDEEAQRQPRGKRRAWNENQQPCLTEPKSKEIIISLSFIRKYQNFLQFIDRLFNEML
jgi:hypothetical protein